MSDNDKRYSQNKREWMIVGVFPYFNRIGRMMYDEHGNCTYCGHHADRHNRRCEHATRIASGYGPDCWDRCTCNQESPRQDAESALAGALWRAVTA
jgi:hypothetical protein